MYDFCSNSFSFLSAALLFVLFPFFISNFVTHFSFLDMQECNPFIDQNRGKMEQYLLSVTLDPSNLTPPFDGKKKPFYFAPSLLPFASSSSSLLLYTASLLLIFSFSLFFLLLLFSTFDTHISLTDMLNMSLPRKVPAKPPTAALKELHFVHFLFHMHKDRLLSIYKNDADLVTLFQHLG